MNDTTTKMQEVREHYNQVPYEHQEVRYEIFKFGLTYEMLQEYDYSGKCICDVGCSTSYLGEYLKRNYPRYDYLGIDMNSQAVEIARAKGIQVREGNNLSLDLPEEYADLTVSEGVIHHTPDPLACFKELVRITKTGGHISLYVYNRRHLYYYIYTCGSLIRRLNRSVFGKAFVRSIIFPIFNLGYVQLGNFLFFKNKQLIPRDLAWNIFSDQILTPIAHFFTREQILEAATRYGLNPVKEKLSINKQGLMFVFRNTGKE